MYQNCLEAVAFSVPPLANPHRHAPVNRDCSDFMPVAETALIALCIFLFLITLVTLLPAVLVVAVAIWMFVLRKLRLI
jgi:hypothetical protein